MSLLLSLPLSRASNANGAVLSGAKMYSYVSGSTTPQDVYTTGELDVAHANPVIADSGGLFPDIYLDPALDYRFVVKTAADVAIAGMDFDPVSAISATFLRFVQSGDGAVTQTVQDVLSRTIHVNDFGGDPSPGHDNTDAFRKAFAYAALSDVAEVQLAAGTYEIASASLTGGFPILRPENVALSGYGRESTIIQITGTDLIDQLFRFDNSTNCATRDMTIIGNGVKSEDFPYAGAMASAFLYAVTATEDMTDIIFEDCDFDNFGSAAWFYIENQNPDYVIRRCGSRRCNWFSREGNSPNAGLVTTPGCFILWSGFVGPVRDIILDDILMEAYYIKGGFGCFGDVRGGSLRVQALRDAGFANQDAGSGVDGPGAYATFFYEKPAGVPNHLSLWIGDLENCYGCGVYTANAHDLDINIDRASGQRDLDESSLPKGIIALNGSYNTNVVIGYVEDCNRVVSISMDGGVDKTGIIENAKINIELKTVVSRAGATDVKIDLAATPWAGGVTIKGKRTGAAAYGVDLRPDSTHGLQDIDLSGFVNEGAATAVRLGTGTAPKFRRVNLERAKLSATDMCVFAGDGSGMSEMQLSGMRLTGPCATNLLQIIGGIGLQMDGLSIKDQTATPAFYLSDSQGTVSIARRINVTTVLDTTGTALGEAEPAFAGNFGDFVESLNPTLPAAGAAQTWVRGWRAFGTGTTDWRPVLETVNA